MEYTMSSLTLIVLSLMLLACSSVPAMPDWINNPGDGEVGSSVTHVKGKYFQEELAIARARERLAARYGVAVSSVQTIRETVVNDTAYVTSDKQINQAVKTQTVKARLRDKWYDAAHDVIYVWMYPVE
jgi:hypothetical protein